MWSLTSPVTGAAETGFTTPSFTLVADTAPDVNGKQSAISAVSGTGLAAVRAHSVSDPFTVTFIRPKILKTLPTPNPVTGLYPSIPRNTYTITVRKGVIPATNQPPQIMTARVIIDVPAGADAADADDVRACLSLLGGALSQQSAGVGDTAVSGVF